jgi:CarD family transcriptional regulator
MAEPSPSIALSVGDRVVYPNQGVCRVSGVEIKEVAGQKLTFVTMKREEDGAVVMVPQAKVVSIGVRKVASAKDIEQIFSFLRSDSDKANLDWKQRARTNLDRMSAGGILGLAEVVKGLQVLSELRPLPSKERELYDNARHLLVAEMSASLNIPECDCEDAIDLILFPPGRERPKRTAEEFRLSEDELGLGDDLLGLGDDLGMSDEEAPSTEDEAESTEAESEESSGEEPEKAPASKKKGPKVRLSDDDVTQPMGNAIAQEQLPPPRKRGRPPKPKPVQLAPAVPKKRGRPPKPKPVLAAPPVPKKRGRPPKAAAVPAKPAPKGKKK